MNIRQQCVAAVVAVVACLASADSVLAQNSISWAAGFPTFTHNQPGPPPVLGTITGLGNYTGFGPPGHIGAASISWVKLGGSGEVLSLDCSWANGEIGAPGLGGGIAPITIPDLTAGTYEVWISILYVGAGGA